MSIAAVSVSAVGTDGTIEAIGSPTDLGRSSAHGRRPSRGCPRGTAAVVIIVLLAVLNLLVFGIVIAGGHDQDLTALRLQSVRAFYAAEAGANMAVREMMINYDEDGDGGVGTISDDGNDANDPALGGATMRVTRSDGASDAVLTSAAREGAVYRSVACSITLEGAGIPFEHGSTTVGSAFHTVDLKKRYDDPVIVCTPNYLNNVNPIVVRVDNVTATSFDLRLQNPGDLVTPSPETVYYIVVEAGAWDIDGVKFEAQHFLSTVTAENNNWNACASQTYLQTYTSPVVVGQVMSYADTKWSVFWCRSNSQSNPPSATDLRAGKHVGEDTTVPRADEEVGFLVFESGTGVIGGIAMSARLSADNIAGVNNSPPYSAPFTTAFASAPQVLLASENAIDGSDGGFAVVYGAPASATTAAYVCIDEDQIRDNERSHTTEQVAVLAFETPGVTPDVVAWREVDPH